MIDPSTDPAIDGYICRSEAEARVGRVLRGKWRLDALLGIGSMAAVYAATHRNGMRGAVKLLHPIHVRDGALRRRFSREGYLANRVEHVGAVRVLDDDTTEDGGVFLVMELLDGEALIDRAIARGGALPAHEVMWLGDQLLDALAAAHERGVVHRDIKPENLFLTSSGILKILDFGLACVSEPVSRRPSQTDLLLGTPAYMAPEQVEGRWDEVDARSDLWSAGATLFALASGQHVYETDEGDLFTDIPRREVRSLAAVKPELPEPLVAVVDRALATDRSRRWPDARSMQEALRRAHEQIYGVPIPPPGALVEPPRVERTSTIPEVHVSSVARPPAPSRWLTGLAGGAVVGVAIGVFGVLPRDNVGGASAAAAGAPHGDRSAVVFEAPSEGAAPPSPSSAPDEPSKASASALSASAANPPAPSSTAAVRSAKKPQTARPSAAGAKATPRPTPPPRDPFDRRY